MPNLEQLLAEIQETADPVRLAALCHQALEQFQRDDNPMLWANLQCAAAASQVGAVRGQFTPELLQEVLTAYEAALTVYSKESTPAIWGQTQRNLGATHLGAVQIGLGNVVDHIEAALAAYTQAVSLPQEQHNPEIWMRAQYELADAYAIAANWRGPAVFIAVANAYAAVLAVVDRGEAPAQWAQLNLRVAASLAESGATEYEDSAIRTVERALELLQRETQPRDWAEAHLVRGGLYRTRASGARQQNLEQATYSLDLALTVITAAADPQGWYRAHYHRGPAYLFLRTGDRADNLRLALESLDVATALTPRDPDPETWASLEVSKGQALFERGDHEAAIVAFEQTLSALPASSRSRAWTLANRFLGEAYLERTTGNADDNTELAIARLGAVQFELTVPDANDPAAWSAAYANLGEAYRRRTVGERSENRGKAIDCFTAALTVPPDQWADEASWFHAQARLALLHLDENGASIGRRSDAAPKTPAKLPANVDPADPFDLAGQAVDELGGFRPDQQREPLDTGWHMPSLLNTEVGLLRRNFEQFLGAGVVRSRTPAARTKLEFSRWKMVNLVLEHVVEKHDAADRTRELFKKIEAGAATFALFLRGFAFRALHFPSTTLTFGGGEQLAEKTEKVRLAKALSPLPLVWIANPVDSGPMDIVQAGEIQPGSTAHALGFRIEAGETWESDVEALIRSAAFVIFHNPVPTPGVAREIDLVERLGRLDDTFFLVPAGSQQKLDDEAIERMRATASARVRVLEPGSLPAVTCRWVEGPRRVAGTTQIRAISQWLAKLSAAPGAASIDLEIDARFFLLATALQLEEMDAVPAMLRSLSKVFERLDDGALDDGRRLVEAYARLADATERRFS